MYIPILAYHKIGSAFDWGINTIPVNVFRSQIRFLAEHNYDSISLEQYATHDFVLPNRKKPVIITFDDADESVLKNAFPILHTFHFTATIFVISGFVGKQNTWDYNFGNRHSQHLTWQEITDLSKAGWEIGSHTATHQDLVNLPCEQAKQELLQSKEMISERINLPVQFISYPFNRFNARIVSLAKKAGYLGGCALYVPQKLKNRYRNFCLPRFGVYSIDTMAMFRSKLINSAIERTKQQIISLASRGTIWYKKLKK